MQTEGNQKKMKQKLRGKWPTIAVVLCAQAAVIYRAWGVLWPKYSLEKPQHAMDLVCQNASSIIQPSYLTSGINQRSYCREGALIDIAPDRNKQQYRSQYGQDRWLEKHVLEFLQYNPKTFVEFGARDGSEHSNTYKLDKVDGYRGILVEAQSSEYQKLEKDRKRGGAVFTYHNIVCESSQEGHKKHFLGLGGSLGGLGRVANPEEDEKYIKGFENTHGKDFTQEQIQMECISLNTLLNRHKKVLGDTITVLSIDCEGCEEEVLRDFDWDVFKPLTIIVERSEDCNLTTKFMQLVESKGYVAVNWQTSDVIFVHQCLKDQLGGLI